MKATLILLLVSPFNGFIKYFALEFFFLFQVIVLLFFFTLLKDSWLFFNEKVLKVFIFLFLIFSFFFFLKKTTLWIVPVYGLAFFNKALRFSEYTMYIKSLLFFSGALILVVGYPRLKKSKTCLNYLIFFSFSVFTVCMLLNANKLFEAVVILESLSFCLYFLIKFDSRSTRGGSEVTIKYFSMGALASGFLLFSVYVCFLLSPESLEFLTLREVFYFATSREAKSLIWVFFFFFSFGIFFKLSVFPFHLWTPEVYDGLSGTTILFFTVVVKGGVFLFYYRFYYLVLEPYTHDFLAFFYVVSLFSIGFGVYGASFQTRIHRIFGYSSINFMGFCMTSFFCIPVESFAAVLVNFLFYSLSVLFFFYFFNRIEIRKNSVAGELETLPQLGEIGRSSTEGSISLAFFFLSIGGVPPSPVFFSKLLILNEVVSTGYFWFIVAASVANILSYFYTLRVVKALLFFSKTSLKTRILLTFEGLTASRLVFLCCVFFFFLLFAHIFVLQKTFRKFWVYFIYS